MKTIILFIASSIFFLLSSCDKKCQSENGIVGKWKLIEEMYDPGDGSGTFQSVNSDKKVIFFSDGTFEANGEMCSMNRESGAPSSGTYDSTTETFLPDNCMSMAPMSIYYSVNGNTLILSYSCTCGCQQKYKRL